MEPDNLLKQTQQCVNSFKELIAASPFRSKYYDAIAAIEKSLFEPCKLAITGRVKAGKSTLINVLLGKDYAVVGTSETTATINIFRYGEPLDSTRPILCEYLDGSEEWISRAKLDSLQGVSSEVISQISQIKHLTYFIKDERLRDIVLIDTPGIDAVVGKNGDAHQEQTELFLGLRKRHRQETISISNNADAVILLLGDVAHDTDINFINGFVNTIGVLSQIDQTDERLANRKELAKERYNTLSGYVNCVVPISAGLKRFLPSRAEAIAIKQMLSRVPSKAVLDDILLVDHGTYSEKEKEELPGINLTKEERNAVYPDSIPFPCFAAIAKILYEHDVDEALRIINEVSGIDKLKEILDLHFFSRSQQIKSEAAIKQLLSIIWTLLNCTPQKAETRQYQEIELQELAEKFHQLQLNLERLSQITEDTNKYFQALLAVLENKKLFTPDEVSELTKLFNGDILEIDLQRLEYWFGEKNNAAHELRKELAHLAYNKYNDLAFL